MKKITIFFLFACLPVLGLSQNVIISTSSADQPNTKAILELKSTALGFLPPRMTSTERNSLGATLTTAEEGLEIYNITRKCKETWTGTKWQSAIPAGTIQAYGGETLPEGWLWCDGSLVGTSAYPDLYAAIGNAWGVTGGDFNLPDLRGLFIRGVDDMDNTVGTGGGHAGNDPDETGRTAIATGGFTQDRVGSLQGDQNKEHLHSATINGDGSHSQLFPLAWRGTVGSVSGGSQELLQNNGTISCGTGAHSHTASIGNSGGIESRPKNAYVNYIIKY